MNTIVFYLYPWKMVARIDQRPFNPLFQKLELKSNCPAFALVQDKLLRGEARYLENLRDELRTMHRH